MSNFCSFNSRSPFWFCFSLMRPELLYVLCLCRFMVLCTEFSPYSTDIFQRSLCLNESALCIICMLYVQMTHTEYINSTKLGVGKPIKEVYATQTNLQNWQGGGKKPWRTKMAVRNINEYNKEWNKECLLISGLCSMELTQRSATTEAVLLCLPGNASVKEMLSRPNSTGSYPRGIHTLWTLSPSL